VAEAALDLQADVELGVLGQVRDHVVGVEHLDVVVGLDVGRGDHARPALAQGQGGALAGAHADRHVLEVQQDLEHVFLQALDRAVLVQHAVDLDLGDRIAGDRGQQHAPQRVAEGMAVATLERFDHDLRPVAREAFDLGTTGAQDLVGGNCHIRSISCRAIAPVDAPPWTFGAPCCQGVARARHGPGGVSLVPRGRPAASPYFEYSSTISASLMSAGRSLRSGTALNTPLNFFWSTSTQDGVRSMVWAMFSDSCTRSCFCAFSDSAITSPDLTW